MRPQDRATARRQIDKRLNSLRNLEGFARPPRGWIKAIREALGMTTAQLGKRLGVSQPRAVAIEKAEATNAITLETLDRAARALDCQLVYALVPRKPLETLTAERALLLARRRLHPARHTMALEAQGVDANAEEEQIRALARKLLEGSGSALWNDDGPAGHS
jgi:predicted DNA-binding mobile mystery protein A